MVGVASRRRAGLLGPLFDLFFFSYSASFVFIATTAIAVNISITVVPPRESSLFDYARYLPVLSRRMKWSSSLNSAQYPRWYFISIITLLSQKKSSTPSRYPLIFRFLCRFSYREITFPSVFNFVPPQTSFHFVRDGKHGRENTRRQTLREFRSFVHFVDIRMYSRDIYNISFHIISMLFRPKEILFTNTSD